MSVSPSNWQRDIQGIPRRAREHLHHPPALPQEGWQGGSSFLKVYLLLSSCWTTWGLPSAHIWAAHLLNAIVPWGKNSVTQMYFAVCFPLSYKAFDFFFFLVPQFPWHKHQSIYHWATRLWNASAWLNVTKICMSRAAPCSCCPAPLARAAVEAECGYQIPHGRTLYQGKH